MEISWRSWGSTPARGEFVVDVVVELVDAGEHVAIEQLVDDQLDAHFDQQFAHGLAERTGERGGADRIGRVVHLVPAADHRQALVHGEQGAREALLVLADHAGDGEGFFQFVLADQAEFDVGERAAGRVAIRGARTARGKIGQVACDLAEEGALDDRAFLADLAHAVEELGLRGVVLGFLGEVEQGVVDVLEHVGRQRVQAASVARPRTVTSNAPTLSLRGSRR